MPPLANLLSLIDDARCYELIRQRRWPEGVRCPHCSGARIGPPPEEWRGGIRTSGGCRHDGRLHAGPCLGRGAVAPGRVEPLPIIEDLDVLEHRRPGLRTGPETGVVDVLFLERGEEGLHGRVVEAVPAL